MSHGHGQFRNMGDFKAIALDYTFWLSNGTEGALYCLDQRDISILLALCEYVGWFTRWINTEDTSAAEIRAIQGELTLKLMSCVDIQVLIDQAQITANYEATNQQIQSQAIRDILADEYDGTPTSINPSAPTTDFGSSGDRYTALCAAITAFVYKFALGEINVLRVGQAAGLSAISIALGAGLLIPGLNVFLLAGAGIALLLGFGVVGATTEVAIAALGDKTALNDVICFMRDTLKAESVTEANWNACLDSYPFTTGSHQAIVADFIKAALADNYLPVLDMLGQGYDSVLANDQLPECPCVPDVRYPIVTGSPAFGAQTLTFVGYDGDYDVWQVMTCDCPTTIVMDNGQTYNHGYNVALASSAPFSIDDAITGGNSLWALWLDYPSTLVNARHFPNNVGPGQLIAQGHTASNILCKFRIKPR